MKLVKRKVECLIALKQYEKAQIHLDHLLESSKYVYKTNLEGKHENF